mmetsp:Transcript_14098/g.32283  ORF Transcript_14098/g.32283 Transcript_14098/m.32283 type:complete len:226 (+) Transcript_14098:3-680(+)
MRAYACKKVVVGLGGGHLEGRAARAAASRSQQPCSTSASGSRSRRREVLLGLGVAVVTSTSHPVTALPLAPLGPIERGDASGKATDLTVDQVKDLIYASLTDGQYFVNPQGLDTAIFADDCRFVDPTNDVTGLSRYLKALSLLFDSSVSQVSDVSLRVSGPAEIKGEYVLSGSLKFPWKPCIPPYRGFVTYTLDRETNLIRKQEQTWSISAEEALKETFSPCKAK